MRTRSLTAPLLLFGILLAGLAAFYGRVLMHPDTTMLGANADAVKNYYTPWYHAKWDSSYTWFEGMNYPWGEHVVFVDAQPLLSNAIKLAGMADHTVGIMNYAMLAGLLFAGWLLYLILCRWKMDPHWAAAAAAAIALLSPQLLKLNGHYGLAYTFVVPLVWLLALRAYAQPGMGRSLLLAGAVFLLGWLHPYYVMISAVFLTVFGLVHALVAWAKLNWKSRLLHIGLQVLLPLAAFALILKLTDPVADRPSDPYGFDQYMATWKSIFFPVALSGLDQIPQALFPDLKLDWEGICYIGMVGGGMFIGYWAVAGLRVGRQVLSGKWRQARLPLGGDEEQETRTQILVSMLAGIIAGLFACGIPFAFKPELTTELFPPIKQFRSLGRFSWVFFYTWMAFAFYLIGSWWKAGEGKKRMSRVVVSCVAVALTLVEGAAMQHGIRSRIDEANPEQGEGLLLGARAPEWLSELEQYDAFIALPYFHEGSENFSANAPANSRLAFQASIATGKPMLNVMMSRTSFEQSWAMMQLVSESPTDLSLLKSLPQSARVLAVRTADSLRYDGPNVRPYVFFDPARPDRVRLYDLMESIDLVAHARRESAIVLPSPLHRISPQLGSPDSSAKAVFQDFETGETGAEGRAGGTGKLLSLKDNNFLHDGPLPFQAGDTVVISLWARIGSDRLPLTELGWEEWRGEERLGWHYLSMHNNLVCLDGQEWALVEREEVIRNADSRFVVNVTRWKRLPPTLVVDDLLIRKKGSKIIHFEGTTPKTLNNRAETFSNPRP